jgi:lipopolysaccharide biosynthesis glycosyltransferase
LRREALCRPYRPDPIRSGGSSTLALRNMDAQRNTIVVSSADRRYVRPLAVTLVSLFAHLDKTRQLVVHVIDRGVPDEDKELIARSLDHGSASISWHSPDRHQLVGVPLWGRMSLSVYDKLLIADLPLPDVDQVLWIDSDTLVLADVAPLWDRGTGRHPVLAVQDVLVPFVSSQFGVARYRDLGLRPDAKYFNAGVILVNLAQWREERVSERALDYVKRYANDVSFWDQEGLNAVLCGRWGELDPVWNWTVSFERADDDHVAHGAAKIIHFNGNLKPWTYDRGDAHYRAYYQYVDRTSWPGWRPSRTWWSAAFRTYERTALRGALLPIEHAWTSVLRGLTRKVVTVEDVETS